MFDAASHFCGSAGLIVLWGISGIIVQESLNSKSSEEELPMAEKKEKAIDKDQEIIKPAGGKKEDLSEKDLEKASGGAFNAYLKYVDKV